MTNLLRMPLYKKKINVYIFCAHFLFFFKKSLYICNENKGDIKKGRLC